MKISINNRLIGSNYKPLVIAEIGINHNGDLNLAKHLVDEACSQGVEIIKHQTHVIDDEMSKLSKKIIPGNSNSSIYDIMNECALSEDDEIELKNYVELKGAIFISTPFSRAAANRLERMGVSECNNYPLIEHVASFGKPMIVSTGMNTIESVRKTVTILEDNNIEYALLHTTNLYPTPFHLVRLGAMIELKDNFPNAVIGLSDHTINNNACLAATGLGASILQRHFIDTKDREGPDILNSMDTKELGELIRDSEEVFKMRGGSKLELKEEQVTMDFAFATVVSIKDISKGEKLNKDNIWVKRPGTGNIKAEHYKTLLGKVSIRDIKNDEHLTWEDFK